VALGVLRYDNEFSLRWLFKPSNCRKRENLIRRVEEKNTRDETKQEKAFLNDAAAQTTHYQAKDLREDLGL
jgi:hypothetical protein